MASKPFDHYSVRFLRPILEDGVAAWHYEQFGTAQHEVELNGGCQTDHAITITPNQQSWNPLDELDRGFELGHFGTPAAINAEHVAQSGRASQVIRDFL